MPKYTLLLHGLQSQPDGLPGALLRDVLEAADRGARGAVRLRLEGRSWTPVLLDTNIVVLLARGGIAAQRLESAYALGSRRLVLRAYARFDVELTRAGTRMGQQNDLWIAATAAATGPRCSPPTATSTRSIPRTSSGSGSIPRASASSVLPVVAPGRRA